MRWTITRQELVLFHPRHKRVRLFYEHDKEGVTKKTSDFAEFDRYRKHAQDILETLREVLNGFPVDAEISFENNKTGTPKTKDYTQNSYKIEVTPPHDLIKEIFLAYLKYWLLCLESEDWLKGTDPHKAVTHLIEHIRALIKNPDAKYEPLDTTKSALIHLLSTLPILPHWDLWGIFSSRSDKNRAGASQTTMLGRIRECTRPVYASQLKYISPQLSEKSISKELLGYQVNARVCYCDDDQVSLLPVSVVEKDFYEYCHNPITNANEKELYRSYGILIDAINTALMGGNSSQKTESSEGKVETLFYIAYPIKTSLGRFHLWHIWLRPENSDATLEQLWASWWPLHQRILNWQTLHASLATELEQLDIAYAQGAILRDIKSTTNDDNTALLNNLVCKYGYMLFPAKCLCTENKLWRYEDYFLEKELKKEIGAELSDPDVELFAGSLWKQQENTDLLKPRNSDDELCNNCTSYKNNINDTILFHEEFHKDTHGIQRTVQHLRYRRLVEQQRFLAEQMLGTNEHQKHMKEVALDANIQELKMALEKARAKIVGFDPKSRRKAIDDLLEHSVDHNLWTLVEVGELKVTLSNYIHNTRELFLLENKVVDDSKLCAELVLLLETDLHALLSWYLESEPVLSLCHDYKTTPTLLEWTVFFKMYSSLHSSYSETICKLSDKYLIGNEFKDYKSNLCNFLNKVESALKANVVPNIQCLSGRRKTLRTKNLINELDKLDKEWRFPYCNSGKFSNFQAELHIDLKTIWNTLALVGLQNECAILDTELIKCVFRFPLSNAFQVQVQVTRNEKKINLYRNCFAFAYNGGNNFVNSIIAQNYPSAINTTVKNMNSLRMGKLFFGVRSDSTLPWSYCHVIEPDLNTQSAPFLELNHNDLQIWLDNEIKSKTRILVVCFDGWDSP